MDPLANEQVFLQLLVAQLKYQDPQSPADGTQFVTQLAQFADLEQVTQSRTDLDAIKQQLSSQGSAAQNAATSATSGSSSSSPSTTSSTNGIS
jgi:flagellar basal-body rod modification protein FlgD